MKKSVPVTVRENGMNVVIGNAVVEWNGSDFRVIAEILPEYAERFGQQVEHISIGGKK